MTIRRLISLSTMMTLFFLVALVLTLWSGFRSAMESSDNENKVALPSMVAMLEARFDVVQVQQYLTDVSATGEADGFREAKAAYEKAIEDLDTLARLQPKLAEQVSSGNGPGQLPYARCRHGESLQHGWP